MNMETLKQFGFSFGWVVFFIFSFVFPDIVVEALYSFLGIDKASIIKFFSAYQVNGLTLIVGMIATYQFKKALDRYKKPVSKMRIFIEKAIRYGKKLHESDVPDVKKRRLSTGAMDESEIDEFRKKFRDWHFCIHRCFAAAFKDFSKIFSFFSTDEVAMNFKGQWMYGGLRKGLLDEIKELEKIKIAVKSDQMEASFDPEILKEYESFKQP